MNREELYNAAIKVYNETGQGLPGGFIRAKSPEMAVTMDELITEGLFKSVHQTYSTLPDEEWVCITKGYCVEDTYGDDDGDKLTFVRFYKGIDDLGFGVTLDSLRDDKKFMTRYEKWLEANRAALEEVIEPLPVPANP